METEATELFMSKDEQQGNAERKYFVILFTTIDLLRLEYQEVYNTFVYDNSGQMQLSQLGNALRALGLMPSEAEVKSIVERHLKNIGECEGKFAQTNTNAKI